jgi:TetR/AcrR family transcriptional regulator, transcriptional repressor of aconitase
MDARSLKESLMARVTQQHVDARRESILDSAARLFARKGLNSATMADIAAEADLSAGAIYRYFSSKEELMRAVFDEAVERNRQMFQDEAESASSPFVALERIGRRIWIELDDRDALICEVQMALSAARDPEDFGMDLSRNRKVIRELLEGMVRAAQESGEIDPDIDPSALALLLQAATGGIQMLKLDDEENIDVEAAFDLMVCMVTGLRAKTP